MAEGVWRYQVYTSAFVHHPTDTDARLAFASSRIAPHDLCVRACACACMCACACDVCVHAHVMCACVGSARLFSAGHRFIISAIGWCCSSVDQFVALPSLVAPPSLPSVAKTLAPEPADDMPPSVNVRRSHRYIKINHYL